MNECISTYVFLNVEHRFDFTLSAAEMLILTSIEELKVMCTTLSAEVDVLLANQNSTDGVGQLPDSFNLPLERRGEVDALELALKDAASKKQVVSPNTY